MTPTTTKQSTTSPIILVLLVLLGFIGGYFYYSQVSSEQSFDVPVPSQYKDASYLEFKDLHFDFSLFSSDLFASLKTVGEYPVQPGSAGKNDPFSDF